MQDGEWMETPDDYSITTAFPARPKSEVFNDLGSGAR